MYVLANAIALNVENLVVIVGVDAIANMDVKTAALIIAGIEVKWMFGVVITLCVETMLNLWTNLKFGKNQIQLSVAVKNNQNGKWNFLMEILMPKLLF